MEKPLQVDIVAELRAAAQNDHMVDQHFTAHGKLLYRAAEEIETLRARRNVPKEQYSIYDVRASSLRAEMKREAYEDMLVNALTDAMRKKTP